MAQQVQITDISRRASLDNLSPTLAVIELPHLKVHEGFMFISSTITSSVADNASIDMMNKVGTIVNAHAVFNTASGGESWVHLYENPTTSANGTAISSPNMNRCSLNIATSTVYMGPTVTTVGTNLSESFIPGGEKNQATGGQLRNTTEWVLDDNNVYLFRATNKSGSAADLSVEIEFYEIAC